MFSFFWFLFFSNGRHLIKFFDKTMAEAQLRDQSQQLHQRGYNSQNSRTNCPNDSNYGGWEKSRSAAAEDGRRRTMLGLTDADNDWMCCQIWFHSEIDSFHMTSCSDRTSAEQTRREKVSRGLSFIKCGTFYSPAQWVTVMTEWSEVKGWAHAWRRDYRRSDVNEITGWGLHCAPAAPQTWKKLCFYTVRETAGEAELTFPEFVGN